MDKFSEKSLNFILKFNILSLNLNYSFLVIVFSNVSIFSQFCHIFYSTSKDANIVSYVDSIF
jgi:hypothetical protein